MIYDEGTHGTTTKHLVIDTTISIDTPEGVPLCLRLCGPSTRAWACLYDLFIRCLLYILLLLLCLWAFGDGATAILILFSFFSEWFYPVFFELFKEGQTPGKKKYNIRVIHADGTRIGLQASMLRNLLRVIDFFPFLYGFGLISCLLDGKFRRLGDLAAGTFVVYTEEKLTTPKWPKVDYKKVASAQVPIRLEVKEQDALIAFAENHENYSRERQIELSEHLALLHKKKGLEGLHQLWAYALRLTGKST